MADTGTITITFEEGEDGKQVVHTWVKGSIELGLLVDGFMWSLTSILRNNEVDDSQIPDHVRESLRAAMLGESSKED